MLTSFTLSHSSQGNFIISHHCKKKGEYSKTFQERKGDRQIRINVIIVYYYNCSILLLIVNLLLCLIYKLNFSIGLYIKDKHIKVLLLSEVTGIHIPVLEHIPYG